nr:DUF1302 domain-containing protein [Comamonas testosteroni]
MKKLTPIAVAALLSLGMGAVQAGETIDLGDGLKFDWRLNVSYGIGTRLSNPTTVQALRSDGNLNFDKGSLTANRLGAVWESKLSKGDSGFVLNASTFYDDVYHGRNDNPGPFVSTGGKYNEFTSAAKRYGGGYSRLLDTYAYTSFNMGDTRATVRVGKQVVNWGESMYFANIAGAQGPSDAAKSASPGAEIKEILLPEDQISASLEVSPRLSLLAHYQFGFHETLLPAVGMYTSTANAVGPGTTCAYNVGAACYSKYRGDIRPSSSGQFGIGGRYRVTDETEVGVYFLNYNDRSPSVITGADGYRIKYFDDIKMLASTVSTTFGKFSAFGEASLRDGTPVSVTGAGVVRAKIAQGNVGGIFNIGRTGFADDVSLAAEISGARVLSVEQGDVNALGNKTRNSLVAGATLTLGYPGIFEGWDLSIPISYQSQIRGRSTVGTFGGGQGDSRLSIGATFVRKSNLSINVAYINYLGNASADALRYRAMTDRDQLSVTAKYSF